MSSCLSQIHRPLLLNEEDIFSCLILNYSLIILFFVCLNVVILMFPYLSHLEQPDDQRGHQGFLLQQAQLQQLQPLQPGQPCHQLLCGPLRAPAPLPHRRQVNVVQTCLVRPFVQCCRSRLS